MTEDKQKEIARVMNSARDKLIKRAIKGVYIKIERNNIFIEEYPEVQRSRISLKK